MIPRFEPSLNYSEMVNIFNSKSNQVNNFEKSLQKKFNF